MRVHPTSHSRIFVNYTEAWSQYVDTDSLKEGRERGSEIAQWNMKTRQTEKIGSNLQPGGGVSGDSLSLSALPPISWQCKAAILIQSVLFPTLELEMETISFLSAKRTAGIWHGG